MPAKMNADLAVGDELLEKTGAGNLFMGFGEPDVEIRSIQTQITQTNAEKTNLRESAESAFEIVGEIKCLDVYDPTTRAICNSSTDDIAC